MINLHVGSQEGSLLNILLLYEELIPSVKLCGLEQLSYLDRQEKIKFSHSRYRDLTSRFCREADVVIFVRGDSSFTKRLIPKLKRAGKYLIYILDDDLLNVPYGLSSSEYYQRSDVKKNIMGIMTSCDCLFSPSSEILKKYGSLFEKTGRIEEPSITVADEFLVHNKKPNDVVRIGFAGTVDRNNDINALLHDVIKTLYAKYGDSIKIEFFGAKPSVITELGLTHYPYESNYDAYQDRMQKLNWDIGLAPMLDTEFNRCKHYNKLIEYASFGIVGVYSNVLPYKGKVDDHENGILCGNTSDEWVESISELIDDLQLREKLKENSRIQAANEFGIESVAAKYYSSLKDIKVRENAQNEYILLLDLWLIHYCEKLFYLFKNERLNAFNIIVNKFIKTK